MLEARGLAKRYGRTHALRGIDVVARRGEVLGIAGPNGAGKSTLVKLLAGEETPTAGTVLLDGVPLMAGDMAERVAVVHQEPQLFPNLTVADNVFVGREGTSSRRPKLGKRDLEVARDLELVPWIDRRLGECPLAIRQRVEIARALVRGADVLLLDEPNSALTEDESEQFFERIAAIADAGHVVLLVTHRLAELTANAQRVVVVRDGIAAAELAGEELTRAAVARELVIGSDRPQDSPEQLARIRAADPTVRALVRLRDWRGGAGSFDVPEFEVAAGEVVAVTGVEGSGARELVRAVASQEKADGRMELDGSSRRRDIAARTEYLPASRSVSLFANLSVARNVVVRLGGTDVARRPGLLDPRRIARRAEEARERFRIQSADLDAPIGSLSGGNQQKVAIAAALSAQPLLLVAEEPTRGVDVGSKAEIYALLREYADDGNAVLLFCTEVIEVFDAADRVFVMDRGRLSDSLEVAAYDSVERLAADIAARERHTAHATA